jgi:hypothetical protein
VGCIVGCIVGWPVGCIDGWPVGALQSKFTSEEASSDWYRVPPIVGQMVQAMGVDGSEESHEYDASLLYLPTEHG